MTFIIMGVAGCGKSTVGRALAAALACPFFDGDDFHPPENVEKMANGIPLTDEDRVPWLSRLNQLLHGAAGGRAVLACSALKKNYRTQLRTGEADVQFIYLAGDYETLRARLAGREGHFMKPGMLKSQFAALEPPVGEDAFTIDADQPVAQIIHTILEQVRSR